MADDDTLLMRFLEAIESDDWESVAYVYKTDRTGRPIKPFWFSCYELSGLVDEIQCRGGGLVRIIIRRKREIQFSGTLAFASRVNLQ